MKKYVTTSIETELFFGKIVREYTLFIRRLLDPVECELMKTADSVFGKVNHYFQIPKAKGGNS